MNLLSTLGGLAGTFFGGPGVGMAVGGLLGGMGGGGSQGNTTSTNTSQNDPRMDQYLYGPNGIYANAQGMYNRGAWSPAMADQTNYQLQRVADRGPQIDTYNTQSQKFLTGGYDPSITAQGPIAGVPDIWSPGADFYKQNMAGNVSSQSVDPSHAFSSMGMADPSRALQQSLSGQVNTSTLNPVVNDAMRRMGENFNEQVMPAINQGATAAGQYGGSRQGIAQGLAAKGLAYSMGDTANSMYNNAYQNAQGLMGSTANNLGGLALNNSQQNAGRDLNAQQFNAGQLNDMLKFGVNTEQNAAKFNTSNNLNTQQFNTTTGLANNSQNMQAAAQRASNGQSGLNVLNAGNQNADQNYNSSMQMLTAPNSYDWQNMKNYSGVVQPGANNGGTTTSQNPYFTNNAANVMGGAMMGGQLWNQWQNNQGYNNNGYGGGNPNSFEGGNFNAWMNG